MPDELTTRIRRRLVTEEVGAALVQNILGHKYMSPTLDEISYCNPSASSETILNRLSQLMEADIVTEIEKDGRHFYTVTDTGYRFLESEGLFVPKLDEIRHDHARVEKTEAISDMESAPRPSVSVQYDHPLAGGGLD